MRRLRLPNLNQLLNVGIAAALVALVGGGMTYWLTREPVRVIHIRWREGVDESRRSAAREEHTLRNCLPMEGRTERCELLAWSPQDLSRIVTDSDIDDTHYVERQTLTLAADAPRGSTYTWPGYRIAVLRRPRVMEGAWLLLVALNIAGLASRPKVRRLVAAVAVGLHRQAARVIERARFRAGRGVVAVVGGLRRQIARAIELAWPPLERACNRNEAAFRASPHQQGSSRPSRLELTILFIIVALACAVRVPHMTRSFDYDELYTGYHYAQVASFHKIATTLGHIGYSMLAKISLAIFGHQEWSLRLPALLLGVSGIVVLWNLSRRLAGSAAALGAALVLAVHPLHIIWSVSARGYSGMVVMTLLASDMYLRSLEGRVRRVRILFVAATVLGAYFHIFSIFVTATQLVHLTWWSTVYWLGGARRVGESRVPHRHVWIDLGLAAALIGLCYLPAADLQRQIRFADDGTLALSFPLELYAALAGTGSRPLVVLAILISSAGLIALASRQFRAAAYVGLLLAAPLVYWLAPRPPDLLPRFFAFASPWFVLLFVVGSFWCFDRQRTSGFLRPRVSGAALAMCAVMILAFWNAPAERVRQPGYRDAMRTLQAGSTPDTVLCAVGPDASMLQYYVSRPLVLLESLEELESLLPGHEIRCAYHAAAESWSSKEQKLITGYLSQHAQKQQFGEMTVFMNRR